MTTTDVQQSSEPGVSRLQIRPDAALSILVHAVSKTGKSTLSSTAPTPTLVLDAEGSWRFITEIGYRSGVPLRVRTWNPMAEAMPVHDETWDVCRVPVQDWPTIVRVRDYLRQPHPFVSFVMDSVSEVQRKCKKNISPGAFQQQDWGRLLDDMGDVLREFRDMTDNPNNQLRVAVFIAESRENPKTGRWEPYVQGQIGVQMPYMFDIVGFHTVVPVADEHGATTQTIRRLLIGPPRDDVVVGERVQGRLGFHVDDPNITDMINQVFPYTPVTTDTDKQGA